MFNLIELINVLDDMPNATCCVIYNYDLKDD
jgi:hypothetical protein